MNRAGRVLALLLTPARCRSRAASKSPDRTAFPHDMCAHRPVKESKAVSVVTLVGSAGRMLPAPHGGGPC